MNEKENKTYTEVDSKKAAEDILFIANHLVSRPKNIFALQLNEDNGFLPHQLPDGALVFVDKNATYKKGDFIIINDTRLGEPTYRIIKSLSDNDKDFVGKVIFQIQKFD
ncbi:hypothetical protein JXA27_06850 [Aerococcaceae bacterium zg-B36]|uniref:hypothetical protein n=1 Tax=Aerococcaceae bacterium zg-252 TaxID=2796928 RepID=UPI001BD898B3|nr:hypothetical protein [Aerococcaceae bacterium zg-B36]